MGKIKIHEIAKKLNLTSKEVLERATELNIETKNHLSSIEDFEAEKIEKSFTKNDESKNDESKKAEKVAKKETKKEKKNDSDEKAPVIIRRQVIVSENEANTKKVETEKVKKKEQVGFVERRKENDYNIVYRNKTAKPMTVSELFGIGKKEETKSEVKQEVAETESKPEVKPEKTDNLPKTEEVKKEEIEPTKETNIETKLENKMRVEEKENMQENKNRTNNNSMNNNQNRNYRNNNGQNNYRNNDSQNGGFRNNYRNDNSNGNNFRNNRNPEYQNNRNNDGQNGGYRNNQNGNYRNNNGQNNYRNNDGQNGYRNNQNGNYRNNGQNGYRNNDGQNGGFRNNQNGNFRNNNQNGGFRNNNNFNRPRNNENRPLDEKGIEKNIKNIMSMEVMEKEPVREYNNKAIDKQKQNNKFDENRVGKKASKSRKNGGDYEINEGKIKSLKQSNKLSHMFNDQDDGMLDYYDLSTNRNRKNKKKNAVKETEERTKQKIFKLTEIEIPESITVKDFAAEMKKTTSEVITKLMKLGIMATINNEIDFDTAFLIASEFEITAIKKESVSDEQILFDDSEDKDEELVARPPVVVVMGHVDHGKTSLLDAVRKTHVIEGESGGITQHIGAYMVKINDREITFLDTPGHEAFTAMRARGAQITDIAILVVAANDGVMPQTVEAINHAKSAGIPIIVAVNKIDLPEANVQRVKEELMQYELVPEEWGGDTIYVPISAKNNLNIDQLLEMVILLADMKELKANPNKQAKGVVIEARLDKNKGPIASILVQRGTLDSGDTIVVGSSIGRIRAMTNEKGKKLKKAGPSTPVEVLGLTEVPEAGDIFYEVEDEKTAKHLIEKRKREAREKTINATNRVTLNDLFSQIEKGHLKELNLIVKADVQGSVEAVKQSLEKLANDEVRVKVIHAAVGGVTETDVTLAKVANAIIIAFNVRPNPIAKQMAEKDSIEIKQYSVIYQAIEDVEAAMNGMLAPKFEEKVIGTVEVRQTFKVSNVGTIAGAYVLTGIVSRNAGVRVIRDNVVVHEGKLASLKRFKDDVKEVSKGLECGIQIEDYNDIKELDTIEVFVLEKVENKK